MFAALLAWVWGARDLFRTVPHYGDALENIVGGAWFAEAWASGRDPLLYPLNYFPEGWRVGSHSVGALLYVGLAPLFRLGGGAFAYNVTFLFSCGLAFTGAYLLARRYLGVLSATLVGLALTFWGLRWHQAIGGQLNVSLASAILPWMLWCVARALDAERGRYRWLLAASVFWALALNFSLYFVFFGGMMVAVWALFMPRRPSETWLSRVWVLVFMGSALLILAAPWLLLNMRESAIADPPFYLIDEVNFSSASLNSLPIPFIFHPWLGSFARSLYRAEPWEQGAANLGLIWTASAIVGVFFARRSRGWLAAVILAVVGVALTLGLTLRWDGNSVQWSGLLPLNDLIWQIGHRLKPGFFIDAQPPPPYAEAIPLPALLLATFMPFWERGRMFVRYGFVASVGVFLLAGMGLTVVRRLRAGRALQVVLAAALLVEIVPPPLEKLPFPPPGHEAYTWLSEQNLDGQGIVNVFAAHASTLVLANFGYNLLAPAYHRQATVSGAAGVRPRHTWVLNDWLATHEHPFWHPDFAPILRSYRVKYIVLEMQTDWEQALWEEAQAAEEIKPARCFPAPEGTPPWAWPICILEVLPPRSPDVNLLLHDGWSGREEWGVWAEGMQSQAQFVATSRAPFRLEVAVFPLCMPAKSQRIALDVNGQEVASYMWPDCEPWNTTVEIPAALVRVGFNDVTLRVAYAEPPPQSGGSDPRRLSVGFSRLIARPQE